MLHHIYRSNIGVLGHGQHLFQRYSSFKSKTKDGAPLLTSNVISRYIQQPQHASKSLPWPVINNPLFLTPSTTVRYKSSTTDRPKCSHQGCSSYVFRRGLCITHRYPCSFEGCGKRARKAGGYCRAHAKEYDREFYDGLLSQSKRCQVDGCEKHVQVGSFCVKHAKEHDEEAFYEYRRLYDISCGKMILFRTCREVCPRSSW